MAMTPEKLFYKRIVANMPQAWHWQRIETSTSSGVPDTSVGIPGFGEAWIEFKYDKYPVSAHQRAWMAARNAAGGKAVCLRGYPPQSGPYSFLLERYSFHLEQCTTLKLRTYVDLQRSLEQFAATGTLTLVVGG